MTFWMYLTWCRQQLKTAMQVFDQFSDLHQAWVTRWEIEGQRKTWEREGTMERLRQWRGTKSRLGKGKETEQELRVPLGAYTKNNYCCMSRIRWDRRMTGGCCFGSVCWVCNCCFGTVCWLRGAGCFGRPWRRGAVLIRCSFSGLWGAGAGGGLMLSASTTTV